MNRVRMKRQVSIDDLAIPSPVITRDLQGRVESLEFDYTSINVLYEVTWVGETNTIDTYTQTITDQS